VVGRVSVVLVGGAALVLVLNQALGVFGLSVFG
jgi:hypothetical protein